MQSQLSNNHTNTQVEHNYKTNTQQEQGEIIVKDNPPHNNNNNNNNNTYIHTYILTYIHKYTHTYIMMMMMMILIEARKTIQLRRQYLKHKSNNMTMTEDFTLQLA